MKRILLLIIIFSLALTKYSYSQNPPSGGNIIGPTSVCPDVVGAFEVSGVNDATEYEWIITGIDPSSISILSPTKRSVIFGNSSVTVTVVPKNTYGSGDALNASTTVNALPNKPIISQAGDVLSIPAVTGATYQWFLNNAPINGATARTYTITATGVYDVEIKNVSNCYIKSNPRNYFPTFIKEDAQFKSFSFYPNPVRDSKITTNFSEKYDLQFLNFNGQIVKEVKGIKGETTTELTGANPGIYLMKIISNNKVAKRKIIVQ